MSVRAAKESAVAIPDPFGPGTIKEIPIFPLGIVAFPTADVPLNIFEARYRVLFNTLLSGSPGIEEDLVNDTKSWCGSRLFGMCFVNHDGRMAQIGTTLHIVNHERLPDGQILVVNKGIEKFRVMKVVEERPVLICQVVMLEDLEDTSSEAATAAEGAVQLFKELIELNVRMHRIPSGKSELDPRLDVMSPREVSYWLGVIFSQSPELQQALLVEVDLLKRLAHEREVLENTTKFLRAKVALQSAFAPESGSAEEKREGSDSEPQKPAPEQGSGEQGPPSSGGPDRST